MATSPEGLLETLRSMDLGALVPYPRGDPSAVVAEIDRLVGF